MPSPTAANLEVDMESLGPRDLNRENPVDGVALSVGRAEAIGHVFDLTLHLEPLACGTANLIAISIAHWRRAASAFT